jgi:hypothetical protein
MPKARFPLYRHGIVPFLHLRQFLTTAVPPRPDRTPGNRAWPTTRTIIPDPGQFHQARQHPTGITVRLEHRPDGLFLVIGDDITYQVLAQPMPRLWWHSRSLQPITSRPLEPGHPLSRYPQPPNRYYILDSLGNRVLLLYKTKDGRISSRHEYEMGGPALYVSDNIKKSARESRRLDKLFASLPPPDRRPDILNFRNSLAKLMTCRPPDMKKRVWMKLILTTRYGWRGEMLETETTAELTAYNHRKWNRAKNRAEFRDHIEPINQARRKAKARRALAAERLPIGDARYIN